MPLIYHIITDKNIGGAGLFLLHLLEHTDKKAFPSLVLLPQDSALIPLFCRSSIPFFPLHEAKEASFSFSDFCALSSFLHRHPCELLHAHSSLSAKLAARLSLSVPIVATRHCDTPFPAFPFSRLLYRFSTDITVCPSENGVSRLRQAGIPEESLFFIPNGFCPQTPPTPQEKKQARERLSIPENALAVGLCGRLSPIKGQRTLLLAAKRVLAKDKRFLFLLLGDGEEREELLALAEALGILPFVCFLGFAEDTRPFYQALDIHLSASLGDETASLSLAEGMSAGLPTVASDCPGNIERVKEGGVFFPRGDDAALAERLLLFRNDEKRSLFSQKARERAAHLPTFKDTASAYAALYQGLLTKDISSFRKPHLRF